ncbi:MAG: site-specific DNA-methyltransferase, partial [Ignavibacteriaceae bacterium]|nr:site-specific DNA-methyltransferase [Ignavibacteriaceae bacterium]
GFAGTHEYTLVYSKDITNARFNSFEILDDELEEWSMDDIGYYKKGAPLRATGAESTREDRPMMFFPILVRGDDVSTISEDEHSKIFDKITQCFNDLFLNSICEKYRSDGWEIVLPMVDSQTYGRWRWGYNSENRQRLRTDVIIQRTKNGISLYKKQRPELGELPSRKPKSVFYRPEYSSGNGTSQIKRLFGPNSFPYPKPEDLIRDFLIISTDEGDIVLDSFLGSGTTAAVAHKMGRRWIGIELGEHAKTHCCPRLKAVVDGEQGGISKAVNWNGGGGFRFYTLAPSLLNKDKYGNWVISKEYNPAMLAAAMAKQEGFKYSPDEHIYWKQGKSSEKDYIFTTTMFITVEILDRIHDEMKPDETLLIACKAFQSECSNRYPSRITIKQIPQILYGKCEFGKDDYSLNIVNVPSERNPELDDIPGIAPEADDNDDDNYETNLFGQRV